MEYKQNGAGKRVRLALGIALGVMVVCIGVYFLVSAIRGKGDDRLLQILSNEEPFVQESGETVKLQDYIQSVTNEAASAPQRYTRVDMDGDGEEELVVYIDCDEGKYLIFHSYGGEVYGFAFAGRDLQNLKTDGTFVQNQNSYTNYFYALEFDKTAYRLKELAYYNRSKSAARIDGKEVTEPEMNLYGAEFWNKPGVQWTDGPDAADPMPLYESFLAGNATALENWQPKALFAFLPANGNYSYAFFDMSGDGRSELCLKTRLGVDIFTVRDNTLQVWYRSQSPNTKLAKNGLVLDESYEYDLSALYYGCWGLNERGQYMFVLNFSWTDIKHTYPDTYIFNQQEVTLEEYKEKTHPYLGLDPLPWKTVSKETPAPNYDNRLLQVVNNQRSFYNEAGKSVYLKDHSATPDSIGPIRASQYTLVDLDGDGTREMVVFSLPSGAFGCYTVLRYWNGNIYGYDFPSNSMQNLKADGSFMEKDSNGNISILTLSFEDTGYQVHELAYSNSAYELQRVYRIGGRYATLEQMTAYRREFSLQPEAVWEALPPTAEDNAYTLYENFLAGSAKAVHPGSGEFFFGTYLLADSDNYTYTLMDMTGDGTDELLIKLTHNLHIFTVKNGRVHHWYTSDARRTTLLNNGAFLYARHGAAPDHINYEYQELDANGVSKKRVDFAVYWVMEEGVPRYTRYEINYKEVTREEYEKTVQPYLEIGSDKITWYPQAEGTPDTTDENPFMRVLRNETPFINEVGVQVYMAEHKIAGRATVPEKYTLVDLDRDGKKELVAYVTPEYGVYMVLRLYENQIYGYFFPARHMINLTADGAFVQSGGAGLSSFVTLTFTGTRYTLQEKAYSDVTGNVYRLDGQRVTADRANAFIQEFYSRPEASWCAFEEGIDGGYKAIYEAFLKGETTAALENGTEKTLAQYLGSAVQYGFSYTFMDRTHDGKPELCIRATNESQYFFTVENGKLLHMYSGIMMYDRLLNDGGLLYERHWDNPPISHYAYMAMDETGADKQVISFSWYGSYTIDGEQHPERYCIDNKEVTKAEYEEKLKPYLEIGDDKIVWFNRSGSSQ